MHTFVVIIIIIFAVAALLALVIVRYTEHFRLHVFDPQIDRAAIRRIDYPATGGNQLVTESQSTLVVQAGLDRQRLLSQKKEGRSIVRLINVFFIKNFEITLKNVCPQWMWATANVFSKPNVPRY